MQQHKLFVGLKSANLLRYILSKKDQLSYLGVEVIAKKVPKSDVKLRKRLQSGGVSTLPALVTMNGMYFGESVIISLYEKNFDEFRKEVNKPENNDFGVREFYENTMAINCDEEEEIGETSHFASNFRDEMNKREKDMKKKQPAKATATTKATPTVNAKPDNVDEDDGDEKDDIMERAYRQRAFDD